MTYKALKMVSLSSLLTLAACAQTSRVATGEGEEIEMTPPAEARLAPPKETSRRSYARPVVVIRPIEEKERATSRVIDPSHVETVSGMSKRRITLDMREVDIENALRLFASEGGINIIASPEVKGSVTLKVRQARVDQVFLSVLQSLDLGYEQRGDIILVAPRKSLVAP